MNILLAFIHMQIFRIFHLHIPFIFNADCWWWKIVNNFFLCRLPRRPPHLMFACRSAQFFFCWCCRWCCYFSLVTFNRTMGVCEPNRWYCEMNEMKPNKRLPSDKWACVCSCRWCYFFLLFLLLLFSNSQIEHFCLHFGLGKWFSNAPHKSGLDAAATRFFNLFNLIWCELWQIFSYIKYAIKHNEYDCHVVSLNRHARTKRRNE